MNFSFDLISDLHVETWDNFDWSDQATSPYCVVAGDVARDPALVASTLAHLGRSYLGGVFYIDGNDEHRNNLEKLGQSYRELVAYINNIPNVTYMQDNVIIVRGVAILATNGWWSYDFDPTLDYIQSQEWFRHKELLSEAAGHRFAGMACGDAAYMTNSIRKLQTHQDVKAIVCVTHTVPRPDLVSHDIDLVNTWKFNTLGNSHMESALSEDTENKIKAWCFGHYHKPIDQYIDNVRYVNNCRGRGNTLWKQIAYYPKRITIDY